MTEDEYQIVFEFAGDSPEEFARVTELETLLDESLRTGAIDGNDVGGGVVNLFAATADRDACVDEIMGEIVRARLPLVAAAYRKRGNGEYIRIWPKHDFSPFTLR